MKKHDLFSENPYQEVSFDFTNQINAIETARRQIKTGESLSKANKAKNGENPFL